MSECIQIRTEEVSMILIHATLNEPVRRTCELKELLESLRDDLAKTIERDSDYIAISAGFSEYMTEPYAAMLTVEFLGGVHPNYANGVVRDAARILSERLSHNLTQRSVLAYPTIRDALPPVCD
jgi:uncharacterized protein (DUF2164 family)